jgi:sterol 24-C-methyltransferase
VNKFYNLVTDFYEYGWGESFHFGPRARGETFHESLRRHEYYLALRLGLDQNKLCADFGCGVGGPMRNIARFSGAKIVGINNNDYQIKVRTHCLLAVRGPLFASASLTVCALGV